MKAILTYILFIAPCLTYSQNWQQVGLGAYINVSTITPPQTFTVDTINNILYSNGNFKTASSDTIWGIAGWNGVKWDSLSSGVQQGNIRDIAMYNGDLFVGGGFTSVGNLPAKYLAKWNGSQWDTLPPNDLTNWVFELYEYNSELHITGMFGLVDTTTSQRIVKWNGLNWGTVGSPPWVIVQAVAMKEYAGELYVGGAFDASSPGILKWNGSNWFSVGGTSGFVPIAYTIPPIQTMKVYQNKLYIAGDFYIPRPNNITYWDGNNYFPVGGGVNGNIYDMTVFNNELYVVGSFTTAGGVPAENIAKWDGIKWCSLGSTYSGSIRSVEVFNNELYIGGSFTTIDGLPISGVAKWIGGNFVDTCGAIVGIGDNIDLESGISIYPNPNNGSFIIETSSFENTIVEIYNNLGQLILNNKLSKNLNIIDMTKFLKGMYFVKVENNNKVVVKKIVYQ